MKNKRLEKELQHWAGKITKNIIITQPLKSISCTIEVVTLIYIVHLWIMCALIAFLQHHALILLLIGITPVLISLFFLICIKIILRIFQHKRILLDSWMYEQIVYFVKTHPMVLTDTRSIQQFYFDMIKAVAPKIKTDVYPRTVKKRVYGWLNTITDLMITTPKEFNR